MITCKSLAATVALIENATEPRASLPVLRYVRITSPRGGPLLVEGTDLEVHARAALGEHAAIDVIVDPGELRAALGTLPATGPVTLAVQDRSLAVRSCTTEAFVGIASEAPELFPKPMSEAAPAAVEIDPVALRDVLEFALPCACLDETRLHLRGVFLGVEPTTLGLSERLTPGGGMTLRAVTTDGHRLAVAERPMPRAMPTIAPRMVPTGAARYLVRALKGADSARIGMDDKHLTVHIDGGRVGGGGEVRVKLIDAQFPPWRQVVPRSTTSEHEIDRKAFAALCKGLAPLAGKGKAADGAGFMLVMGDTPKIGIGPGFDGKVVAPPKTWRDMPFARRTRPGTGTEIGVCVRYLREALDALVCARVYLGLNGGLDPLLFSSAPDGEGDRIVIMPMRI